MKFIEKIAADYQRRLQPEWLQVNLGYRCNQQCHHCYISGSADSDEMMEKSTIERLIKVIDRTPSLQQIDLTGGSPELHPHLHFLIEKLHHRGKRIILRTNLTVHLLPEAEGLIDFFVSKNIHLLASFPSYKKEELEGQRGQNHFLESIKVLKILNAKGYGVEGRNLELDLVVNPTDFSLSPPTHEIEDDFRNYLWEHLAIRFNRLHTLNNMPIGRFQDLLIRHEKLAEYMTLLQSSFNPEVQDKIMCRRLVSINWEGKIFDCDFNQARNLPIKYEKGTIFELEDLNELKFNPISFSDHCFGCTAGQGSSFCFYSKA